MSFRKPDYKRRPPNPHPPRPVRPLASYDGPVSDEVVQVLDGRYYKTSQSQYDENLRYVTQGFTSYIIPVTVESRRWSAPRTFT